MRTSESRPGLNGRTVLALLVAVVALGAGAAIVALTAGSSPRVAKAVAAKDLRLSRNQYLRLAEQGITHTSMWWDDRLGWYFETLADHKQRPLATIWDTNGLFEALDEGAIADPTPHNRAAVEAFASGSQRYWNPALKPQAGFSPYPGDRSRTQETFYDDNGWLGLAFLDADRATGSRRYLRDAERAFSFIAAGGWDKAGGGGMWWTNEHQWRSGEALAADADLAARLYQTTRRATYLRHAQTYIGWADAHLMQPHGVYLRTADHPYGSLTWTTPTTATPTTATPTTATPTTATPTPSAPSSATPAAGTRFTKRPECPASTRCAMRTRNPHPGRTPHSGKPTMVAMPHDGEGAMLSAMVTLCQATRHRAWCSKAERLANAAMVWLAPFTDGPQYESILLRGFVTLYALDHRARWYRFAAELASLVIDNARTSTGVYLRGWDRAAVPGAAPGMLRTDAANIGVLADLATVKPPTSDGPAARAHPDPPDPRTRSSMTSCTGSCRHGSRRQARRGSRT